MALNVKICGIKSISHVEACVKGKAKMIGLMFYNKSPRFINIKTAKKISNFSKNKIKRVGVFANSNITEIKTIAKNVELDYLQLHGNETENFIKNIKKILKIKIIKALKISNNSDIKKISRFKKISDYILIDTKIIKKNNLSFKKKSKELDWNLLKKIKDKRKLILSGALNTTNLAEATGESGINFVDASSSLEIMSGKKNIKKINKFLELATKL
ncbi:MAG: phosphoribosylanthranilate isomerase [Alphaproteobacteria bacterium]|nr:phosphoribosylanthranilate isomerase [Alphaproteobacteria bacterium]